MLPLLAHVLHGDSSLMKNDDCSNSMNMYKVCIAPLMLYKAFLRQHQALYQNSRNRVPASSLIALPLNEPCMVEVDLFHSQRHSPSHIVSRSLPQSLRTAYLQSLFALLGHLSLSPLLSSLGARLGIHDLIPPSEAT